jgi:NAD-dependent dihydropyrimidine dehydrogenase PreA subunit
MAKRKIIEIDDNKCNGCGQCIPGCPEGALQIIEGKARLVSDLFCDGLGACIGTCPKGAIRIIEREAEPYDEKEVMARIVRQGSEVTRAHLEHLKEHGEEGYLKEAVGYLREKGLKNPLEGEAANRHAPLPCGCPGSMAMDFRKRNDKATGATGTKARSGSELGQWPVQLMLVPPNAPYLDNADLLIAADCVPFAYANFHEDFLKGRSLVIGCPKLDDIDFYKEKLTGIIRSNNIRSITLLHMEVPCCYGLRQAVEEALKESGKGKEIKLTQKVISIKGRAE